LLQTMRSSAKIVMWILLVSFVGGFLLVESSGLLGRTPVTPTTAVATVNGTDILYTDWQRRSQELVQQQQQQAGRSLTQDEITRIDNQAFENMVADILLQQEYRKRGIVVSDDELRDYARFAPPQWVQTAPDLQTDGRFDPAKYQRLLASSQARQSGLLVALEQYFRSEIPKEKLFEQVTAGLYVTDTELWRAWQDSHDSASIALVAFKPTPTAADSNITDSDLHAYYDAHKAAFDQPAHARLSVLYIPRVVSRADSASVRTHLLALRAEILGGAKFEDVAKRESADSASAVRGGDLGKVTRGQLVPEFEKVAFALKPGELSQPVLTSFGYHLIRVDSSRSDTLHVRHILLRLQPSDSSAARVDHEADQLSTLAASATDPAKFDAAGKQLHLTPFSVSAIENQPAMHDGKYVPSVSAWAFGGATVGETSDLFDADDGYYLARLDSLVAGGTSFDAVKADVRGRIAQERAVERVAPAALQLAKEAASTSLEAAAAKAGRTVVKTGMTTRTGAIKDFGSLGEAIGAAFTLPLNTVSAPIRQTDGVFVIRVDGRKPSDKQTFEAQKSDLRARRLDALRQQRVQMFLDDLRKTAKVVDKRKEINAELRHQSAT
jgi:peptidyl-prolyl cis-trans isomerase D